MRKIFTILVIAVLSNLASFAQKAILSGEYASRTLSVTGVDKVYFEEFNFINAIDSFLFTDLVTLKSFSNQANF